MRSVSLPTDLVVGAESRALRIMEAVGRGGEGDVFLTLDGRICKVYRHTVAADASAKLKDMVGKQVNIPGVCWPQDLVRRRNGGVVGYVMPRARGRELVAVLRKQALMTLPFQWNRLDLVRVAVSVVEKIQMIHSESVLLGDINLRNIKVDSDGAVFFLDLDSCQLGVYTSPVGQIPFLAPELIGKNLRLTPRTKSSELFAVATLLFMILAPGKSPYSHCGGDDPAENVRKGLFPYCRGGVRGESVPAGPWRFVWSHFPRYLKDAFHRVFSDGDRIGLGEWLSILRKYEANIVQGYITADIFPSGFKKLSDQQIIAYGGVWSSCVECGSVFAAFKAHRNPLCANCLEAEVSTFCVVCRSSVKVRKSILKPGFRSLCVICRRNWNVVLKSRRCIACGGTFGLTGRDISYFESKGYDLPLRCDICRDQRRR